MPRLIDPNQRQMYKGEWLPPLDWEPLPDEKAALLRADFPAWAYDMAKTPEDALNEAQLARLVSNAVDELSPRLRQALRLYFWEGETLQEAGEEMGVSRERFRQILWQAIAKMRKAKNFKTIHQTVFPLKWDYPPPVETPRRPIADYLQPIGPLPAPVEYPETLPKRYLEALRVMRTLTPKQLKEVRRYYNSHTVPFCYLTMDEPVTVPEVLLEIQRMVDRLTKDEERQVRDFIGQCREKDCNQDAGKHGYCHVHHIARFGFGYVRRNRWPRTEALQNYPLTRK